MIEFHEISDFGVWNDLVLSAADYSFLQSWQQGELAKSQGKEVQRFMVTEQGRPVLIYQVTYVKAKRGRFAQLRHGPIFLPAYFNLIPEAKLDIIDDTLEHIRERAVGRKSGFVRLQALVREDKEEVNFERNPFLERVVHDGYRNSAIHNIDSEKTLLLDITKTDDELLANMRKQTRYNIRKAGKVGVSVRTENSEEGIDKFYKIHKDTTMRQDFKSYSQDYYQKAFTAYNSKPGSGMESRVLIASHEGRDIAAAIIIFFGDKAFYSDGGSLTEFSKIPGSYALQWEAIKQAKEFGATSYNFWGGVSPDRQNTKYPWYGIDLFKRGFGGKRIEYMHPHDLPLKFKYSLTRIWESIEKSRRGY